MNLFRLENGRAVNADHIEEIYIEESDGEHYVIARTVSDNLVIMSKKATREKAMTFFDILCMKIKLRETGEDE